MPEYKTPMTRKALKSKVKKVLMDWLDEDLDDSGDTSTLWDDADDSAARTYECEIEDGKSHAVAMKEARQRFFDIMKDSIPTQMDGIFDGLGE